MSVVLGIVRGHRGTIDIRSALGNGTTIRVLFPTVSAETTAPQVRAGAVHTVPPIATSILLIDDEESVRDVCTRMLQRIGVNVRTANDGRMAIGVFESHRAEVGLVLLDYKMPQLDGIETYQLLRRIDPNVRVVLSSGYTEHEIAARFADLGFAGFIQKPYTLDTLRDTLLPLLPNAALDG